jgi:hypothetical protein
MRITWKAGSFALLVFSLSGIATAQQSTSSFRPAEVFRATQIFRLPDNSAYMYETSHAAADADGAPNAYHPADLNKNCRRDPRVGLDCLANAGYPRASWWKEVLVVRDFPRIPPNWCQHLAPDQ